MRMGASFLYVWYVLRTIPKAFEAGSSSGLAYSMTILVLYFVLATLRSTIGGRAFTLVYYLQAVMLPPLADFFIASPPQGVVFQWWGVFVLNATPMFTLLEGFCSLLTIQAVGKLGGGLPSLVLSACFLSTSIWFVFKLYVEWPQPVEAMQASMLGSVLTLTTLLGGYAISSNRGSPLEVSLLTGYIVKCCYEVFPQLNGGDMAKLVEYLISTSFWDVLESMSLVVLLQLVYRLVVFFSATKIIPLLSGQRGGGAIYWVYLYSPCVVIAVYTNLMIQSTQEIPLVVTGTLWNWVNVAVVLGLYWNELKYAS